MSLRFGLVCSLFFVVPLSASEPWATYRGTVERTGNTDGKAGPATPKVLWVVKSQEHFLAAPVPAGDKVFVSGLGAFNVSTFRALAIDPKAEPREAWKKTTPYLKLPTVSSPAIADGKLLFGDGMHQTDGAILHCMRLDTGLPLWQFPVPGTLVHMEGGPTIEKGKVYLGGGAAGVMCVDMNRVTLDGKEIDLPAIQKILDAKWKELLKKYEEDLKKDPDFAVKPNEDQLPKPAPTKVWQQGKEKWHVDAPVAVVGDVVLATSAFLDEEKIGERALFALDAKNGEIKWRTPLTYNPWGGPTVSGDLIVVTGSSIRYDTKAITGAKGDVAAYELANGKEKWRKELKAGVLGCAVVADGAVIITATDGKVRSYDLKTGEPRWNYDAKMPIFAPPAVAGGVVYAGDLKGVIHAIDLSNGAKKWTLDLGTDTAVAAPGMVYGGPTVSGGRVYVATCNLEGPNAGKPTAVVCIGEK